MKVILTDFVQSLGAPGDEIDVAPGYARNYLIPKGLGFEATASNRKTYENNLKQRARKMAKAIKEAEAQKAQVDLLEKFVFTRRAGEDGRLFGSVTSADIEKALAERGFNIGKRQIELKQPIKTVSEVEVMVKIHTGVSAKVMVAVEAEVIVEAGEEDEKEKEITEEAPASEAETVAEEEQAG